MPDHNNVKKMTPEEKLGYVHAYLEDMIAENEIADPQLSAGLKVLKKQLDNADSHKTAERVVEALAGNLPDISKGIIAAKAAFEKGDSVTGAAEIMNICAAVAPIIGAFSVAGGPPGMLVGALFTVIGQIIALFQPATESDVDKIKSFLLSIEAEETRRNAQANFTSIRHAAKGLRNKTRVTKEALKLFNAFPGLAATNAFDHNDYLRFSGTIREEILKISEFKLIDGPTVLQHWGVASWLQDPTRQDQEEWPEILGIFCQGWADLLTAYVTVISFVNGHDMQLAFAHVAPTNTGKWSYVGADDDRKNIENDLQNLVVCARARLEDIKNCNETMSDILNKLTPVARRRGVFVVRGSWDTVAFTLSPSQPLWGPALWASCSRFLLTAPKEGLTAPRAQYHLWVLDTRGPQVGHQRVDSQKRTTISGSNSYIGPASGFSDICALPSPADENGHSVYVARENGVGGDLESYKRGADGSISKEGSKPIHAPMFQVRAVPTPRQAQKPNHPIIYGALRSSAEIYVNPADNSSYVPSPWESYSGIAVDPDFVWVWKADAFACATHASVMRCIEDRASDKKSTPQWLMGPSIQHLLFDGEQYFDATQVKAWPPSKGLVDFSPCEDGTLFISLTTRKVEKKEIRYVRNDYTRTDSNALYTAVYHIDLEKQSLTVEPYEKGSQDTWMKLPEGGQVQQVQKLPIYCWPLMMSLKEACENPAWNAD